MTSSMTLVSHFFPSLSFENLKLRIQKNKVLRVPFALGLFVSLDFEFDYMCLS